MTRQIIEDKINYFYQMQRKVHLTKIPTGKFPKGKWYNGLIVEVFLDKILFLDKKEENSTGPVEIPKFEIADIEIYEEDK